MRYQQGYIFSVTPLLRFQVVTMGHDGNKPSDANKPSDHQVDKHENKDNAEKNARKARGEASNELESGSLNDTTKATRNKQHESGKSGITDYKFPPAKGLFGDAVHAPLTKDAEQKRDADFRKKGWGDSNDLQGAKAENPALENRLHDRAANHHRDIAAQIKEGLKNGGTADKHPVITETTPEAYLSDKTGKSKVEHHDSAPFQIPKVDVGKTIENMFKAGDNVLGAVRLSESETWNTVNLPACNAALERFPELKKYGVNEKVIAGIILNEVLHRAPEDDEEDNQIKKSGHVISDGKESKTASIGPAQMQIENVSRLVEKYPNLNEFKSDPLRTALEPGIAPFFVAAYLQEKVDYFKEHDQTHPKEPTPKCFESLLYTYNPDVVSRSGISKEKLQPQDYREITVLEKIEAKITHHRAGSLKGWESENYPRNVFILQKSGVVKNIKEAIKSVESHFKAPE